MPPRTRIEETVLDLTDLCATVDDACGWVTRAVGRRLSTVQRLQASIAVRCRLRWRGELTRLLSADGIHPSLEYRYYRDVECRHRLPRARRQAWASLAGRSCYHDVLYDKQRVAVELDGRDAHPAERRWADIRRDNAAAAAGFVTLRYGWLDVSQRPCECAAEIARVLIARGGATSRPCGPSCPVPAAG
jgi:very-short-patch-repair endonuclease